MSTNRLIDVHTHITTPRFLRFLEDRGALWEDGFPIPEWSLEDCIHNMDDLEIAFALLSPMITPLPY